MNPATRMCPYPGLRRFEESDAHLYFGRERETLAVLERLRAAKLIAVTGESGCGKSSLIRAGVIPALNRGFKAGAASRWCIAIMQPGGNPIGRLARAVAGAVREDEAPGNEAAVSEGEIAETALRSSSRGLLEVVRQAKLDPRENLLVLVDQFEELFRFKQSCVTGGADEDARAFVKLLLTATQEPGGRVYVILTMRSDFLGDCAQFTGLPEAINRGEFLVSRMSRDEVRQAITGPAAVSGAPVAPRLTTRLLNEIGDDPGELPVLQHALMRTWSAWNLDHGEGEPIDFRHYEAVGTLRGSLSQHANETLRATDLGDAGREIAEGLFRALTDSNLGGRAIRRPTAFGQLCKITGADAAEVQRVLGHFAGPGRGFLTPDPGCEALAPATIVDLTHESLMARWDKLKEWIRREYQDAELYRILARDAELHAGGKRSLLRQPELGVDSKWRDDRRPNSDWAERYAPGFDRAMSFLGESERNEARERRTRRLLRWGLVAAALVAIAALGWAEKSRADIQTVLAEDRRQDAIRLRAEKTQLQTLVDQLKQSNPGLSDEAQRLRTANRDLSWSILQLQGSSDYLTQEIAFLKDQNDDLAAASLRLDKQIADTTAAYGPLITEIAALTATRDGLRGQEQAKLAVLGPLERKNGELRAAAAGLGICGPEIRPVESNLMAIEARKPAAIPGMVGSAGPQDESELTRLKLKLKQLEAEKLALTQSIAGLEAANQGLQKQQAAEQSRNQALQRERDGLRSRTAELAKRVRTQEARLAEAREKLDQAMRQRTAISNEIAKLNWSIRQIDTSTALVTQENDALAKAIADRKAR